jgi:hypothetical protein
VLATLAGLHQEPKPVVDINGCRLGVAQGVFVIRLCLGQCLSRSQPRSSSSPSVLADDLHAGPIAPRLSFGGEDAAINHNRPLTVHYPLG